MTKPIVRFAPSPTGRIHIGNARTALLNYLFAHRAGGQFILRYDDTDIERSTKEFADGIAVDLDWMGIKPDLVIRQSERFDLYHAVADKLRAMGKLYACYETEEELDRKRKRQAARHLPPVYDRAALKLTAEEKAILSLRPLVEEAAKAGQLNRSMFYDVLEVDGSKNPLSVINGASSFAFHHGERMNRQVSMIAAYNLELDRMRKDGKKLTTEDRQAAAKHAIDVSELLNGGATANSAPLLAKNSIGKVLFMYKRYGVAMYYMLFKTARDSLASADPEVRKAAKKQIAGIFGMSALMAGACAVDGARVGTTMGTCGLYVTGTYADDQGRSDRVPTASGRGRKSSRARHSPRRALRPRRTSAGGFPTPGSGCSGRDCPRPDRAGRWCSPLSPFASAPAGSQ